MSTTTDILKKLVDELGGTIIVATDRAIGFRDTDQTFRKLLVEGDSIILVQVSGPEKGMRAEIASLSSLLVLAPN